MTGQGGQAAQVEAVIADLSELRSSDPAARPAVHAIRLAQLTLEAFWRNETDEIS